MNKTLIRLRKKLLLKQLREVKIQNLHNIISFYSHRLITEKDPIEREQLRLIISWKESYIIYLHNLKELKYEKKYEEAFDNLLEYLSKNNNTEAIKSFRNEKELADKFLHDTKMGKINLRKIEKEESDKLNVCQDV